jgi:branched-chain amino acid aminotransferase
VIDRDDTADGWVFLNGQILPLGEACISPLDRGFQYGDGVFTTLRAESGHPSYLTAHLARLVHSLKELRIATEGVQRTDWSEVLGELLQRNGLQSGTAAVKIIVTRGVALPLGLPEGVRPTLFIQARRYQPPSPEQYASGWRLQVCRQGYAPPLARHKSLNYLFYMVARQMAVDVGADEAIILDAHGRVTETAAGTLLVRSDGHWWTPNNLYQLPGVTLEQIQKILQLRGRPVESRSAAPQDLTKAQTIWVLNSLLGVMPVRSVDDHELPVPAAEEARDLREELFLRGTS